MTDHASGSNQTIPRPLLLSGAVVLGLLLAAAVALWAHYGTTVFYEVILAGIAACF